MSENNNITTELKACPHCASHKINSKTTISKVFGRMIHISCGSCGAMTKGYRHIGWAIRAWNKRVSNLLPFKRAA